VDGLPARRRALLGLIVVACAAVFAWPASPARADSTFTDPAFQSVTLAGGLDFPTTVTWAPDGRMFIAEKFGYVRVVTASGSLLPNPIIDIHDHTVNSGDRGLLGLAAAPAAGGDVKLYMLYTKRGPGETDNQAADTTLSADATLTSVTVHANNTVVGGTNGVDPTETPVLGSVNTTPASTTADTANGCPVESDDCIPSEGYTHTIGTVQVDPKDGSLWVSTGDGYSDGAYTDDNSAPFHLRALHPNSLAGKILHIHTNGTGFTGSPFCPPPATSTTANCSKVWAEGFRNPFRFTLRQLSNGTYQPIGGDVGEGNWEELNDMTRGYNGGWPCWEGNVHADGSPYGTSSECMALGTHYNHAFYLFDHFEGTATDFGGAIVGGPAYSGSTYPATYKGKMFSTDYVHGWIRFHNLTSSNPQTNFSTFLNGQNAGLGSGPTTPLVSLLQAPDGNLVDTEIYGDSSNPGPGTGSINEIRYSPTDKSPVLNPTASATCIDTNTTSPSVQFAAAATDPDGDTNLTYTWDFGDGHTQSGTGNSNSDPTHSYTTTGTFLVQLKVTDSKGNSNRGFLTLHIGPGDSPPNATIVSPTPSVPNPGPQDPSPDQYIAGQEIHMSGSTTSGAGSEMSWLPVLFHGGTHTHVLGSIPTPTGDVPDLADGVPPFLADAFHGADSYYVVYFTVTKNGCSTTRSEKIQPQEGLYKMDAFDQTDGDAPIPVPLSFVHTSIPDTAPAPHSFTVAKNAIATASAPTWIHGGYTYTFSHWVLHDSSGDTTPSPANSNQEVQPYLYPAHIADDASQQGASAYYTRTDRPPTALIANPANGSAFITGQKLTVTSGSSDPEDGTLGGSSLAWTVARTANGATSQVASGAGSSISFTPNAGGDFHASYTISLKATDSHGMSSTTAIVVHVGSAKVTLASNPPGITLSVGSTKRDAPFTLGPFFSGFGLNVSAPGTASVHGSRYLFAGWSDGGKQSHTFTVPLTATTLTATYVRPAHAVLSHSRLRKPRTLSGTLAGGVSPATRLSLALRPARITGKGCLWWSTKKHKFVRSSKSCRTASWLTAKLSVRKGVTHWSLNLGAALQPGSYVLLPQVRDKTGLVSKGAALKFTVTR
jgi:glucose/arabinose dehydrogenase